ncbi:glycoprotein-N-acetylgalactosamine 3-beta-galactosyltransferase 1-like [Limulus polyphemus]|uniref:Glycoprotein-N-acetylgalactosamine 3-beta-galactosyltransferase 1-like n=1 Tax=Limulus polyphemus TaxID=6850 RepID=A0ABM1S3E1_LIMPO|nr:glycoprotein-N-acetylgalactosamine 3-beta-galactosyltransferase 1-like [Limulus polyphemus]XP_022238146.1 glycoprotein-N-acetylgalactosamine 3-beta-galactosyltransferase 1-like [Limulus polyphemus]XP_022238147.1 glycoprotein-N-acetylgalactosamine 3-beta-galactosyltransferase 1-like [Limulus polyphemus]
MECCKKWLSTSRLFLFICACLSGMLFAFVWRKYEQMVQYSEAYSHYTPALRNTRYDTWLYTQGLMSDLIPEENISFSVRNQKLTTEADFLFQKVSIFCLVRASNVKGAKAVKETWAKHCNSVKFFGPFIDDKIPVFKIPAASSFSPLCQALVHVWKKHYGEFKWILITDDETFAIIENVRYYVASLNASHPYYLGHSAKHYFDYFNMADSGILLSVGAIKTLHSLFPDGNTCIQAPSGHFGVSIGKILQKAEIMPMDTRDQLGKSRFNAFSAEKLLIPGSISIFSSYWKQSVFLSPEGGDCCSDHAITFHGISPSQMYIMEYCVYRLTPFKFSRLGLGNKPPPSSTVKSPKDQQLGKAKVTLIQKERPKKNKGKKLNSTVHDNRWKNFWKSFFSS